MNKLSKRLLAIAVVCITINTMTFESFAANRSFSFPAGDYTCPCSLSVSSGEASASMSCTVKPGYPELPSEVLYCSLSGEAIEAGGGRIGIGGSGTGSCSGRAASANKTIVSASCSYYFLGSYVGEFSNVSAE